ncbi:MAG: hypothetical protein IJM76_06055 [Lachnospiraceae bacterium]|nr:hypothetical protein [Lachnospiraceae bacterium]
MIVTEQFTEGGTTFVRTYSDKGMKIHGGFPEGDYDEAVDPAEFGRTYTETNIPINDDESEEETDAEDLLNIIIGGENDD